MITVPTPLKEGVPDLSFIEAAGRMLSVHVTAGATVVLESTTYLGTTVDCSCRSLSEMRPDGGIGLLCRLWDRAP